MTELQLMALYAIAALYGTGSVLAVSYCFYRGITYRLALAAIGWKPPLQWQDCVGIVLDAIFTLIAWPFALRRFIKDERARRRTIQQSC